MVSVLDGDVERHHPALEPNYVSVLEEDGALWANVAAPSASEWKRGDGYFGQSSF